jgi:hypothetical protein
MLFSGRNQREQQKATIAANAINPRKTSVIPALIRSTGRKSGEPNSAFSGASTSSLSGASAEFFSMALSVEHPAAIVNGTKVPVTDETQSEEVVTTFPCVHTFVIRTCSEWRFYPPIVIVVVVVLRPRLGIEALCQDRRGFERRSQSARVSPVPAIRKTAEDDEKEFPTELY